MVPPAPTRSQILDMNGTPTKLHFGWGRCLEKVKCFGKVTCQMQGVPKEGQIWVAKVPEKCQTFGLFAVRKGNGWVSGGIFVCLSLFLSLSVCPPLFLSVCLSVCLSLLSLSPSIFLCLFLCFCLSLCLPLSLFMVG